LQNLILNNNVDLANVSVTRVNNCIHPLSLTLWREEFTTCPVWKYRTLLPGPGYSLRGRGFKVVYYYAGYKIEWHSVSECEAN